MDTGRGQTPKGAGRSDPKREAKTADRNTPRKSPDGRRFAYIDSQDPFRPPLLFCVCDPQDSGAEARRLSKIPVLEFQWARDSNSLWVIAAIGADEPIGRLDLEGRFQQISEGAAMRRLGGLAAAANGALAWVESDGSHHGTIWIRDGAGQMRVVLDPNSQISRWRPGVQEVVRWKNSRQEELQGVLARPAQGARLPLIVDPYSSWRNRFLNIPVLGNYIFVWEGFAVFFPNHRAPHTIPAAAFGDEYVGASKDRDPVDVLTDDVLSGIDELVRRGIADPERLFLYSFSNGASAINQLLPRTWVFRVAVSFGGVADWLSYYQRRRPLGDQTIPGFLGGKTPETAPNVYCGISPLYQADRITTPLLLAIGENDSRFTDTMAFYTALQQAGRPVTLVQYPGEVHGISASTTAEQHVRRAIAFFRAHMGSRRPTSAR